MESKERQSYQTNLKTNKPDGGKMKSDSGREGRFIRNADVKEEFEAIFKNPASLYHYKNHLTNRLRFSIISKYERNITPDDILSILKMKIYAGNLEWNRNVYKNFRHFMNGQIQNIIHNKEKSLNIRFEKARMLEDSGEKIFDVKPIINPPAKEEFVEINSERLGKELGEDEDRFAYHSCIPKKELDRNKFKGTAREILKGVDDTEMLVIFNGMMEGKTRKEIKEEYGFDERDYQNNYRRMLYKLKRYLPPEYEEMFKVNT